LSFAIDANILLYASDASSRFHERALDFLRDCAEGPELLYLPWPTVMAYLRIATHPAIFEAPLSPAEAISNVEGLLGRPHVRAVGEDDRFWGIYREISEGIVVRGNLVPDAHVVALLIQSGVTTIWTHDRDFRKFSGIRVREPFDS
jgi:toxin-antitoxin system PIN domain toxin